MTGYLKNNELERMWKDAVVVSFEGTNQILSHIRLPRGTQEDHENQS